jgi:hypothetical protein
MESNILALPSELAAVTDDLMLAWEAEAVR